MICAMSLSRSPSSRRAWIEISTMCWALTTSPVALLAEGVDRNQNIGLIFVKKNTSPSSRRAWIEILLNV